jgi:uncharacterized SAM-binding protein YcdF (DUF218 family)
MKCSVVVALGYRNDPEGKLHPVSVDRCDQAIKYVYQDGCKIVLTGGYGLHFNTSAQTHASYMANYLVFRGLERLQILAEVSSGNTIEDATLLLPVLQKYDVAKCIIVTSCFHLKRAKYIFERVLKAYALEFVSVPAPPDIISAHIEHERKRLEDMIRDGIPGLPQS